MHKYQQRSAIFKLIEFQNYLSQKTRLQYLRAQPFYVSMISKKFISKHGVKCKCKSAFNSLIGLNSNSPV